MFKRWLLRVLASLLTASLCSAIITTVLNQTILSSHYLEGRITAVNGYNRLSADISSEAARQSGLSNTPQTAAILRGIINPETMQQKVNGALDGLQSYYQGKAGVPTINFNDLAAKAQTAGVPLGQDSDLFQPVTLGPKSGSGRHPALDLSGVRTVTMLTSVVLAVVLGVLSWKWRRYGMLPNVLIGVGFTMGLIAVVAYLGPGRLSNYITLSGGSNAFAALASDLVQNIARDLARRFGVIAGVCLGAGLVTRILAARLQSPAAPEPGVAAASGR